jgi:sirohydrochlorin ferrochelatase
MPGDIPADMPAKTGILLVGHGTRSQRGIVEFLRIAELVAGQATPLPVEPAFLELSEPTIQVGLGRLIERGVRKVVVAPLLLFAAGHAQRDIPCAVADALAVLGAADCATSVMAGHLGCHSAILEVSGLRFTESLLDRPAVAAGQTCLLFVGRGSPDESATAEMHEFARLRAKLIPVAESHVAFLAMARPAAGDLLTQLAAGNWRRIVVQPHLLLHGELYENLLAQVANMRDKQGVTEWIVTSYLAGSSARSLPGSTADNSTGGAGPDELVARAMLARIAAACPAAGIRVVAPFTGR